MNKNILIVVGITILFLGTCINPSVAIDNVKESFLLLSNGNTLYVGGMGSGNYTRIQDAIDNASDGDTVFVFDDSSPYKEHLQIGKSIVLVGEEKHSTIIEFYDSMVIHIMASKVTVSNFTIQHSNKTGISVYAEDNTLITDIVIADNIINNTHGVQVYKATVNIQRNIITNSSSDRGISLTSSIACIVHNIIIDCEVGIDLTGQRETLVAYNDIRGASNVGIYIYHSSSGISILNNNIQDNLYGIYSHFVQRILVKQNNFIKNSYHADFENMWFTRWSRNYWDNWDGTGLYVVKGIQTWYRIPWFVFDWHPAKKPYDI